jgi:hypothetical protein
MQNCIVGSCAGAGISCKAKNLMATIRGDTWSFVLIRATGSE